MTIKIEYQNILDFWFNQEDSKVWFTKNKNFDQQIIDNFSEIYQEALSGKINWNENAHSSLALIILLDQFPRNMFRDTAKMYQSDPLALRYSKDSISNGYDQQLENDNQRLFLYMPHMHSEYLADQKLCIELLDKNTDLENSVRFAKMHHDIIAKFGRFPHRNNILGRESTPEEIVFLKEPNSSF